MSRQFWFWGSAAIAAWLAIAPVAGKWDRQATEAGFIGSAVALTIAAVNQNYVRYRVTEIKVRNRMEHQYNLDETVHLVNRVRAMQQRELQLLMGANSVEDFVSQMMNHQLIEAQFVEGQLPAATESTIQEEDLAYTLATATNSGTLIVAPSGCGKTRLLQQAIVYANAHHQGKVDFALMDCKGDEAGWLGLENDPDSLIYNDEMLTDAAYQLIGRLKQRLRAIAPAMPTIAVLDEWNNGLETAAAYDEIADGQKYEKLMKIGARGIVTKGRSKRVYGWMTTHTPKTDRIGMDGATRQSLNIIILARGNKLGLIASVLKGTYQFVDDDLIRSQLAEQFQEFMQNPDAERPLALTNLGGQWRLVKLANYPDKHPPLERQAINQSVEEILDDGLTPEIREAIDAIAQDNHTTADRKALESLLNAELDLSQIDPAEWDEETINRLIDQNRSKSVPNSLPVHVERLIRLASSKKTAISWKQIRHFKGNGEKFSKQECIEIFKQAEALGWGIMSQDTDEPTWYLLPQNHL